ncbi:FecR family protein [Phytopseudomonas dryadis]|uniref:Iron dicitrate transport regulator FecR n=1 Tax=Phytopseudomonas dryadis TaxID=2487520 RepID=A0A4V2KCG8_9GAMM|nr:MULTISPECIES: FecR domain-containing protein [Pseudomonas]TBU94415.1 iron dicitrate transport regulator FecR [Pseudomonas dryadis]TBU99553.1 iron dicitrate transport regulator FecR [Pseudomonas dryadis]TBV12650.1 iron dicitrate transport regulator FecR [Pseudomonas sp. FRB 230]
MSAERLPPAVAEAVEWLARQRSGSMSESDARHLQRWLQASQDNRQAWERVQQRLGMAFDDLPTTTRQVLSRTSPSRRHLLRGALGLTGIAVGGYWLQRAGLLPLGNGELRSGLAQRRSFALEDGSQLLLNAQSRVEPIFDAGRRLLILHEGALLIQVAADPQRPLIVRSAFGEARALGTRFSVALGQHETRVWVQESRVRLHAPTGDRLELASGQGASLDANGIHALDARRAAEDRWEDGLLEVHDQSLENIIEALRPYRRGLLRVDPDAALLRVSGVFPLDDSDQVLRSLQEVLPIRVEQRFGWWTQLSLR